MGLEAVCDVVVDAERGTGRVHLDSDALIVRGELRVRVPFSQITALSSEKGWLDVRFGDRRARLFLGPRAEFWATKIRSPRGLMDKLGVKPGSKVSLVGIPDSSLVKEFRAHADSVSIGRVRKGAELVFFGVENPQDLNRLKELRSRLAPTGSLWVFWRKGGKTLREDDIRAVLPRAGLVDVKVASISAALSGLKLMIPRSLR